ncbi:hypothetical protein A6B34_18875 [Mycolicibacterium monacense]|uniref:Enoyl-CoA hydratase n=3 Tax=Mycobacteriaceae TaxID=1762 RepID=A0AAD1N1G5_MYCMB|nr:hypothetical protein [Mycolicibacterium monacense]MDA4101835.1 hypothetical protein [Mycolicibacterium monacense DSM 44395]OBB69211.1 hypothetical protein A6B34_18875 [Mycolicibacterium monacense]OBF50808.1 hypothetical protein A5778_18505 [Mycolicibacterium monacense]ORB12053.1 hypothetical protein BST34_27850 [Mycolicibacterium monacense DSM 44395]QHP84200.1 hypothetical protein EWR22_01820 [Mycolicibacterium monacense DSM 44395]
MPEHDMRAYDYEKMKKDAEPFIKFEKDVENRIAYITFDRPEAQNSTTMGMRQNYADLIHKCNVDDDVKDNDLNFPPEWRLSRSGRNKP